MKTVEFVREGGFVYFCTEPGDMSGEYIPASFAPTLAAEVSRLQDRANFNADLMAKAAEHLTESREEIARLQAQVEAKREALALAIDYLVTIAHDENHIVLQRLRAALGGESPTQDDPASIKDFFTGPDESTGKDPYVAFGEWCAANGYDVEDESQLQAAVEAYGGEK